MSTLPIAGTPAVVPTTLTQDGRLGLGEAIVFGVVALVTVVCSINVLAAKRAVNIAINMTDTMISLAVLYIVNESPFMGITQVVVYTGIVMTLTLLVIMLMGIGGDEPVGAAGTIMKRPVLILLGLELAGVLTAVVRRSILPKLTGLKGGTRTAPSLLVVILYHDHVVTMELTAILFIAAAVGALTLTHRQRIRVWLSQRTVAAGKMQNYTAKGIRPGQKPIPSIYASTNSVTAPVLNAQGEAVEESVPRVLRAHGQGLELSDVSLEIRLAQRLGTTASRLTGVGRAGRTDDPRDTRHSGMPSMFGAATPTVKQPVLSDDGAADSAAPEQKEEK